MSGYYLKIPVTSPTSLELYIYDAYATDLYYCYVNYGVLSRSMPGEIF